MPSHQVIALWVLVHLAVLIPWCQADEVLECPNNTQNTVPQDAEIQHVLDKDEAALILLLGFGGLSVFLAILYILIRRYIFDDVHNLDSSFDAGGNVSASLTAVTIASQLLWPADLMQSAIVVVKYGIAGVFWYCGALIVNLSLFPLLSYKLKTKAPGAKTYLQIIHTRCGRPAHIVFCVFALLVNIVILASIIVGGIAVLQMSIKDASPEYCVLLLATLCGSYSFIGGLGSTFYVSYFNALTTFVVLSVLVINVFYMDNEPFGSLEEIYAKVNCLPGAEGNRDGSFFTFLAEGAVLWAVQGLFLTTSMTYCDQASWQSRIAAKPLQGSIGFLLAGLIWFACPATMGTVTGITYLAFSSNDPTKALSESQINSGIVSAYMSQQALGKQGGIMMLTMLTMLTMSTGSGEIMGVSSIIVYDVYQTYARPFRLDLPSGFCIFCGLRKEDAEHHKTSLSILTSASSEKNPSLDHDQICKCPSPFTCKHCKNDLERLKHDSKAPGRIVTYKCPYHGDLRTYQDSMINFKNWCILWVTVGLIPFGLAINASGVDLNWTIMCGTIFTIPCFPGVILSILWSKVTGLGLIVGSVGGLITGITANLLVAFLYYEGEGGFLMCTSNPYSVVAGTTSAMLFSITVTMLVSLCTTKVRTPEDVEREWQKMRDIDNPLHPWSHQYAEDFPEVMDGVTRPAQAQLEYINRHGRLVSIVGSIAFLIIFIIVIPSTMASLEVLTASEFRVWTSFINIWCLVMAVVIVIVTPIEEVKAIVMQIRAKRIRRTGAKSGPGGEKCDGDGGIKEKSGGDFDSVRFGDTNGLNARHRHNHDVESDPIYDTHITRL